MTESSWVDVLRDCIGDVVAMRPTDPVPLLAQMLLGQCRPDWKESAQDYGTRHGLHDKITRALDRAGIDPSRPQQEDVLQRLSAALSECSAPALPRSMGTGRTTGRTGLPTG